MPQNSANTSKPRSSDVLKNVCADTGLIDIWRHLNPKVRDYTFYSYPHNSYSRLDYFFILKNFLYSVQTCSMDSVVLSDHAPIHLYVNALFRIPKTTIWRFNTSFFNSDSFFPFVQNSLSQFWLDNKNSPVSSATIWDAAKATFRGHLISNGSHQKKSLRSKQKNLEREMSRLEQIHSHLRQQTSGH